MIEPTIETCVKAYVAFLEERRTRKTAMNADKTCGLFLTFLGGDAPLSTLTKTNLEGFYTWCRNTPGRHRKPRSLDTSLKYVKIVETWWSWAANRDEYAGKIPPPRKLEALPRDAQDPIMAPTWDEMDAAIASSLTWYPLVLGAMRTLGLRVKQVLQLKVRDIIEVEDGPALRVPGAVGKTARERRGRIVPIGGEVIWFFKALTEGRATSDWLIPAIKVRDARTEIVNEAWERAGVRAEVWTKHPNHAFRKGFESGLRAAGAEQDVVEFLVGRSLGVGGRYIDPAALKLRRAVNKMPPFSDAAIEAIKGALAITGVGRPPRAAVHVANEKLDADDHVDPSTWPRATQLSLPGPDDDDVEPLV